MANGQRRQRDFSEILVLALVPAIVGALILISWALAHWSVGPGYVNAAVAVVAVLLGGYQRFISAFRDALRRKITVNVFVAVALIATLAIGQFRPAAIVVFIMAVASALESYTLDSTRKSIRNLLDLAPQMATVRRGQEELSIPVNQVKIGDVVVIRPGGRIPVDGVVACGASSVNQAPITGESVPVEKLPGDTVFSGTLNESGRLEISASKIGRDTTLAKIVRLTEHAQATKAPVQSIADRFTTWFFPAIVLLAVLGFVLSRDVEIAVSVLLVACPCAFAIATPTAVTAGVSNLARRAVLVKGGVYLELAGKLDSLLVDKTGTFTLGEPKVVNVVALDGWAENDILRLTSIGEKYSGHPLAKAILAEAVGRGISIPEPDNFKVEAGKGIIASWQGKELLIGNESLLNGSRIRLSADIALRLSSECEQGRTPILVSYDGSVIGLVSVADRVRAGTAGTISLLKKTGIRQVIMLTGDNLSVARAVAAEIGVDEFRAELLPEQKLEIVQKLQAEGHRVGMVGDGINDAPALAQADVGIAMGAAGTDVAIETAGVTLMSNDLGRIVELIAMSKAVLRRIKLNIFFSIVYNVIGLSLSLAGLLTPILAVTFQEAGCITVVLSSTLLLLKKPGGIKESKQAPE